MLGVPFRGYVCYFCTDWPAAASAVQRRCYVRYMTPSERLPSVVIVGRPNVGKSTLFNAITGQRRSIVGDEPGITRDRIYGEGYHRKRKFELIDTGGIIPNDDELIPSEILKQARVALEDAAQIIFVIDGRTEITGIDRDLAKMLRKLGKPVSLAVNKIDHAVRDALLHNFYSLGFENMFPVSAEHKLGLQAIARSRDGRISGQRTGTKRSKAKTRGRRRSRLRSSGGRMWASLLC